MTTGFVAPPRWSPHQLDAAVASAIESFRHERSAEPVEQYGDHLDEYLCTVDELMELTVDLLELPQRAMEAVSEPRLLEALRFCAGPFVSEDDLAVLAQTTLSRKRLLGDPAAAARVVDTILLGLDGRRFPWVEDAREATERERAAAVLSTAVLLATERTRTARRSTAKLDQEGEVAATLLEAGFRQVPPPASIRTLEEAPGPGEFCHEVDFGGRKADLVVGLWDRRRMPVECKVSNSSTNSYKRVNNDAAVKAVNWLQVFGRDQVVPAAVLAGVFKAGPLTEAQDNGLTLFWAHRLDDLVAWIDRTRP